MVAVGKVRGGCDGSGEGGLVVAAMKVVKVVL